MTDSLNGDYLNGDYQRLSSLSGDAATIAPTDRASQTELIHEFEAQIAQLLQDLKAADGGGGSASGSSSGSTPPIAAATPSVAATAPSSTARTGTGGTTVDIDGGDASGHGVTEKVDNNTGADAKFGWENAQGQVVGELDLKNGESGAFNVNADGQDGKSARLIKLNDDGSVPAQSNLDETNLAVNADGSLQVSPDVSQITAGNDPTQISITDGNGKTVGNGAPGGSYLYPTQDQSRGGDNPMTMAMDTSNFYDNNFSQ